MVEVAQGSQRCQAHGYGPAAEVNAKRGALGLAIVLAMAAEGLILHAKPDIATGQPNICYGDTQAKAGDTATPAECAARLQQRMAVYLAAVDKALPDQPDTRRAALADFCYNVGITACTHSNAFRKIRAGDVEGGCGELLRWVYAGGKKLPGLVTRRRHEWALCLQGEPQ